MTRSRNVVAGLRGLIAERRISKRAIAAYLGYSETLFSLILNGHRPMPEDFQAQVHNALDRLEAAENAAQKERERVLAE